MPEGPELHIASQCVNRVAQISKFSGKVVKSEVSLKNPSIDWDVPHYSIRAESRGKEVKLWLQECPTSDVKDVKLKQISLLFRFGMSGSFKFTSVNDLPKHSHLRFYTKPNADESVNVLSFVDYRRFGRWEIDADWGIDRGPCPISDYENFRTNVTDNLENSAFCKKPICEVLLNQKYFNGIGNYLRAEILFRSNISPFEEAKTALLPWRDAPFQPIKVENSTSRICDPLYLCHSLSCEVLALGDGYDVENGVKEQSSFNKWLQCYQNPCMKNLTDRHKRTIWFYGEPGPLVPKDAKSRKPTPSKRSSSSETKLPKGKLILAKVPKFDLDSKRKLNKKISVQPQIDEDAETSISKDPATQSTSENVNNKCDIIPPTRHKYSTRSSRRTAEGRK